MDKSLASIINDWNPEWITGPITKEHIDDLITRIESASYRFDPYPNGLTKIELIDTIAKQQNTIDKARNLLRLEHESHILESYGVTMEHHRVLQPECESCRFLEETSTVKS